MLFVLIHQLSNSNSCQCFLVGPIRAVCVPLTRVFVYTCIHRPAYTGPSSVTRSHWVSPLGVLLITGMSSSAPPPQLHAVAVSWCVSRVSILGTSHFVPCGREDACAGNWSELVAYWCHLGGVCPASHGARCHRGLQHYL